MLSREQAEAINAHAQEELDAQGDMDRVISLTTQVINDHPNAESSGLRADAHFLLDNQQAGFADTDQSIILQVAAGKGSRRR